MNRFLRMPEKERATRDIVLLRLDAQLTTLAQGHSKDMAEKKHSILHLKSMKEPVKLFSLREGL